MLTLPIKKKWFDMIESGEKKEEYRDITPYYEKRIRLGESTLRLRNGYAKNAPMLEVTVNTSIKQGLTEWGAEEGQMYFALSIIDKKRVDDAM